MRVLIVHCPDIKDFPPVQNLIHVLCACSCQVTLITKDETNMFHPTSEKIRIIKLQPVKHSTLFGTLFLHSRHQRKIRELVEEEMKWHDILWTTTDTTVRELGNTVLKHKHIMQLLELIYDIPSYPCQNLLKLKIERYAHEAWKVVVPEINRAYIQRLWWNLKKKPVVLPNKPFLLPDNNNIPLEIRPILETMRQEKKKIILYQGVFYEDRDLNLFAQAIAKLTDNYCFYVMGKDNDIRQNLCKKYPFIHYVPFIMPPNHLYITQFAHVGILPYTPCQIEHYSEFNALYCAPNKIFEYAAFGIPMIGSDVPGLVLPFEKYNCGIACDVIDFNEDAFKKALSCIDSNYDMFHNGSKNLFNSVDLMKVVSKEILEL